MLERELGTKRTFAEENRRGGGFQPAVRNGGAVIL